MPLIRRSRLLIQTACALLCSAPAYSFDLFCSLNPFCLEVKNFSASPGALSFSSADPSATSTTQATVLFRIKAGHSGKAWSLTVSASGSSFANCSFLPASAVLVTCASASVSGGGTAACGSAFGLSTSAGTVASGVQGSGNLDYTILINYTLTDAWKYPGKISPTCSLTLNYTVAANE